MKIARVRNAQQHADLAGTIVIKIHKHPLIIYNIQEPYRLLSHVTLGHLIIGGSLMLGLVHQTHLNTQERSGAMVSSPRETSGNSCKD